MSKYDDIFLSTETIQDFIDKNNIKNKKDLQNRFGSIYNIFRKDPRKDNIIFPKPSSELFNGNFRSSTKFN